MGTTDLGSTIWHRPNCHKQSRFRQLFFFAPPKTLGPGLCIPRGHTVYEAACLASLMSEPNIFSNRFCFFVFFFPLSKPSVFGDIF